ncbi:MAG: hypothetical protein WBB07_06495 [Mycobacterium sp.]
MPLSVPTGSAVGGLLVAILLAVAIMFATAVWVYRDATASAKRGRPITSTVGSFQLRKPVAWFFATLLLWEMCFPLYLDSRGLV